MKKDQLSVAQALKFTRHDFLNDLQIILMNLDLGNTEQARKKIRTTTDKMKQHSMLSSLSLPKTEIWLTTFEWLHTSFDKTLTCHIKSSLPDVDDDALVSSLTYAIQKAEEIINPMLEYHAYFDVKTAETGWSITVKIEGDLQEQQNKLHERNTFTIEEQLALNLWTFTFRGR